MEVKYPVIFYSEKFIVSYKRERRNSIISFLEKGSFVGDTVIDSLGNQFVVKDVRRFGRTFNPWRILLRKEEIIKIKYIMQFQGQMTFEEVKQEIRGLFERHPRWTPKYRQRMLQEIWDKAETIQGLIDLGYAHGSS